MQQLICNTANTAMQASVAVRRRYSDTRIFLLWIFVWKIEKLCSVRSSLYLNSQYGLGSAGIFQ